MQVRKKRVLPRSVSWFLRHGNRGPVSIASSDTEYCVRLLHSPLTAWALAPFLTADTVLDLGSIFGVEFPIGASYNSFSRKLRYFY